MKKLILKKKRKGKTLGYCQNKGTLILCYNWNSLKPSASLDIYICMDGLFSLLLSSFGFLKSKCQLKQIQLLQWMSEWMRINGINIFQKMFFSKKNSWETDKFGFYCMIVVVIPTYYLVGIKIFPSRNHGDFNIPM